MTAQEIAKDLFFIERGYLSGNHFVYRSEEPVLIDTGYRSHFEETARRIEDLGVDLSKVGLIVNTHCHGDHIGGNKIIQERSGCAIALHKIGKHFIETKDSWATWWKYYGKEADFFTCTRTLEDGDTLQVGPHEFQVIHAPGHAADGIVLYNRKERILISSDVLWENNMAVLTMRIEGNGALFSVRESLEKLEALDVEVVYPGHGKPFTTFRDAIRMSKKRLDTYLQDRDQIGTDLLKKMMIFNLLMNGAVEEEGYFPYLMRMHWFPETVDLYFEGEYRAKYDEIVKYLFQRGILRRKDNRIFTTVKK